MWEWFQLFINNSLKDCYNVLVNFVDRYTCIREKKTKFSPKQNEVLYGMLNELLLLEYIDLTHNMWNIK